jgi:hypothetical protein
VKASATLPTASHAASTANGQRHAADSAAKPPSAAPPATPMICPMRKRASTGWRSS